MDKRLIIEIYATENEEKNEVTFDFERKEDTKLANNTMKMLLHTFVLYKGKDENLEFKLDEEE